MHMLKQSESHCPTESCLNFHYEWMIFIFASQRIKINNYRHSNPVSLHQSKIDQIFLILIWNVSQVIEPPRVQLFRPGPFLFAGPVR